MGETVLKLTKDTHKSLPTKKQLIADFVPADGTTQIPCFLSRFEMKTVDKLISSLSAEFIISLAEKHPTFDCFKAALLKNGADFTVSPREIKSFYED